MACVPRLLDESLKRVYDNGIGGGGELFRMTTEILKGAMSE